MTNSSARAAQNSLAAFWAPRREAAANWLAFGLLLAAWNASDNEASGERRDRPRSLRAHPYVTVRTVQRAAAD